MFDYLSTWIFIIPFPNRAYDTKSSKSSSSIENALVAVGKVNVDGKQSKGVSLEEDHRGKDSGLRTFVQWMYPLRG